MQLTLDEMNLRPPDSGLPAYIVVEGPIGVGKSTLARALAYSLNYDVLLELPEENPFLERFYQDRSSFALQTQLSFLFQRTRQLGSINQGDLFHTTRVADFMLEKDALFAEVTLDNNEMELYTQIYEHVVSNAPKPDLVVYLQAPISVLTDRIKHRGIESEQHITADYLERLNDAYMRFFHQYNTSPLLIVNAAEIDFANDADQYRDLAKHILQTRTGRHFYNPVTRDI